MGHPRTTQPTVAGAPPLTSHTTHLMRAHPATTASLMGGTSQSLAPTAALACWHHLKRGQALPKITMKQTTVG